MIYDIEYYENMLRMYSQSAEQICKIRWDFVDCITPWHVLDYGSGVGWFRAYRPEGVEVDTFDVGPYPQTGITRDSYDLITLWDVIEHLPTWNPQWEKTQYVALTVPILPEGQNIVEWKHWKPSEHLKIFTEDILDALFEKYGFEKVKSGYPECPPRVDIGSFLYRKVE